MDEAKPVLYDLCCSEGGTTKGYQEAGFYVIGVDIELQPNFIGDEFIQMGVIEFLERYLAGEFRRADAFGASPPCQGYGKTQRIHGRTHPMLIEPIRVLLKKTGRPYVIENVPGAPLINPIELNGAVFGIRVHRPRLFECSFGMPYLEQPESPRPVKMGRKVVDGDVIQPVGNFQNPDYARREMECYWMTRKGLSQAIPVAYTRYIGKYLMKEIQDETTNVARN